MKTKIQKMKMLHFTQCSILVIVFHGGCIMKKNNEKFKTGMSDRAFKEIFLNQKNTYLLKVLLESVLKKTVNIIGVQNTELLTGNVHVRAKRVDANIWTDIGIINIEINSKEDVYTKIRNTAYIFNIYNDLVKVGKDYTDKINVIQINFSDGLSQKKKDSYYYLCNPNDTDDIRIKNLEIYDINMNYYRKIWYTNSASEIEENKYIIMLLLRPEELEKISKDRIVRKYMDELIKINEVFKDFKFSEFISPEEDMKKIIESEKTLAREKGMKSGMKQGMRQGIQQGIKKGKEQGLKEGSEKTKCEIATNLLKLKFPIEQVSQLTSLSIEKLQKLV